MFPEEERAKLASKDIENFMKMRYFELGIKMSCDEMIEHDNNFYYAKQSIENVGKYNKKMIDLKNKYVDSVEETDILASFIAKNNNGKCVFSKNSEITGNCFDYCVNNCKECIKKNIKYLK